LPLLGACAELGAEMKEPAVRGIHAGRTGDANSYFLKKDALAISWPEMGNLPKATCDRRVWKIAVAKAYLDASPGALPNHASQILRFACEMLLGDPVPYPSNQDRVVHFSTAPHTKNCPLRSTITPRP
jgi:restriction system protein